MDARVSQQLKAALEKDSLVTNKNETFAPVVYASHQSPVVRSAAKGSRSNTLLKWSLLGIVLLAVAYVGRLQYNDDDTDKSETDSLRGD